MGGILISAVLIALAARRAPAHDFWVEPASYRPGVGEALDLRLRVGEGLAGEEFPRSLRHVARFEVLGPAGSVSVPGEHMELPAGRFTPTAPGLHWVVYRSRESVAEVEAATFGPYLEEEGNAAWLADWKAHDPEQKRPVREAFSRCLKCLLRVQPDPGQGGAPAAPAAPPRFDAVVGLKLELVLEADPATRDLAEPLPLRLLWDGAPLAGAQVRAHSAADPRRVRTARTDASGRAALDLDLPGVWLIKSVHLERAEAASGLDYRSTWAALTLERAAPQLAAPARAGS